MAVEVAVEDVVQGPDVDGLGDGGEDTGVESEALLPVENGGAAGGGVGGERAPPPGAPGAACPFGCSTIAYRHTGHVPLVFSHVIMQSSWNA